MFDEYITLLTCKIKKVKKFANTMVLHIILIFASYSFRFVVALHPPRQKIKRVTKKYFFNQLNALPIDIIYTPYSTKCRFYILAAKNLQKLEKNGLHYFV